MTTVIVPGMEIVVVFTCLMVFVFHCILRNKHNSGVINWPVIGMLPTTLWNLNCFYDAATKVLRQNGGTLEGKGPLFCNMDVLLTCDPKNANHILCKRFQNYPRGPEFNAIFDPIGNSIIAADGDSWAFQRKMVHSFFKAAKFQHFLESTVQEKVRERLYPVLDRACSRNDELNLQDVLLRLGFDIICQLILGCDPECLSLDFPEIAYEKAIGDIEKAWLFRYLVPEQLWKLLKRLQLGPEKRLSSSLKTYDRFVYQCIDSRRRQIEKQENGDHHEQQFDFTTTFLKGELVKDEDSSNAMLSNPDKFLRDAITSLLIAGRDTSMAGLSWLFWLLAKNPSVEENILQEIKENLDLQSKEDGIFNMQELNKLVYLHATVCETLRLYPSVPNNHKASAEEDTLPSGHHVKSNSKIFIMFYAMARMESVWGKDCLEFKPERWISEKGGIEHVPSYKFSAFSAGPRSCVGKEMSFVQMKTIVVAMIIKYKLHVVEDQPVMPGNYIVLHMKHGLKVRVSKRSSLI